MQDAQAPAELMTLRSLQQVRWIVIEWLRRILGPIHTRAIRLAVERLAHRVRIAGAPKDPSFSEVWSLLLTHQPERLIEKFQGTAAQIKLTPNVTVSRRSVARYRAGLSAEWIPGQTEPLINMLSDQRELMTALQTAEVALRALTQDAPLWAEAHRALARNYWFQGRFNEALACFAAGERSLSRLAAAAGWDPNAIVILPRNCAHVIGLMGHIDAFVKRKILAGDRRPYYLLAPDNEIVNRAFLRYWENYITVVTAPEMIARLTPLEVAYGVNWNWVLPQGEDGVVHVHAGMARIQRQWASEQRPPLLRLDETHAAQLERQKAAWGMQQDDWFVCLHVRSTGFYAEKQGTAQHFRNTTIDDYYPLIRSLAELGGWVIRMGDPTMPPLDRTLCGPKSERVIDYAHLPERSAELDVSLCASCRLFISSPSGLHTVAHAFGRPVCYVNFPIYAGFPWHPNEIFAPQLYFSRSLKRVLTLEEILSSELPYADHYFLLQSAGVDLLHNKPIDIVESVREALSPDEYRTPDADVGLQVRRAFEQLNQKYSRDISGRLGLYFGAAHAHELCPEGALTPGL